MNDSAVISPAKLADSVRALVTSSGSTTMASATEPNTSGLAGATVSQNRRVRTAAGGQRRPATCALAGLAAVLLGLAYGLCLVSGLRQAEQMAGPDERGAVIAAGRALAGLCSGVVFGAATAWVQEVSPDDGPGRGLSARRSALALTAGFGLGPVVAAVLAQWAADPLVLPYLPHLVIGIAAAVVLGGTPATRPPRVQVAGRRWPPAAVRSRRFWLAVAPASPLVFGSVALAIVVLPEEVTSARTLSAGFAGLMTALSFAAGVAVQPFARRLRDMLAGAVAGLGCAAAGAAVGIAAVAAAGRVLAGVAAVLLGLAYGLCLVSGLRQAEHMASPDERGAVIACYYAMAYTGFAVPYLAAGLGAVAGKSGAFVALTAIITALALWTAGYAASLRRAARVPEGDAIVRWSPGNCNSMSR